VADRLRLESEALDATENASKPIAKKRKDRPGFSPHRAVAAESAYSVKKAKSNRSIDPFAECNNFNTK
jgi:hypothetical protein